MRCGDFRLNAVGSVITAALYVVTEQHNKIRVLPIGELNNLLELLLIDETIVSVNIADQGDAQAAKFRGPIVDPNRVLMNNKPVRFDEKSPDETRKNREERQKKNRAKCF